MSDPWRYFDLENHSPEWEKLHRPNSHEFFITASYVANLFGFGFRSIKQAIKDYSSTGDEQSDTANVFLQRLFDYGNEHEPIAREQFLSKFYSPQFALPRLITLPEPYAYVGCTLDMLFFVPSLEEWVNVEIKCPYRGTIPDTPPAKYIVQCQLQMHVTQQFKTKISKTILYYWTPEDDRMFFIRYNETLVGSILVQVDMFKRHVTQGEPYDTRRRINLESMLEATVSRRSFLTELNT